MDKKYIEIKPQIKVTFTLLYDFQGQVKSYPFSNLKKEKLICPHSKYPIIKIIIHQSAKVQANISIR